MQTTAPHSSHSQYVCNDGDTSSKLVLTLSQHKSQYSCAAMFVTIVGFDRRLGFAAVRISYISQAQYV